MKKIIVLAMILILGLSLAAFAVGAMKLEFIQQNDCEATGFVIINTTPEGATETTIEIQIRGLEPGEEYDVVSGKKCVATFTAKKNGHANVHCNLPLGNFEDEEDLGRRINIYPKGLSGNPSTRLLMTEKFQ